MPNWMFWLRWPEAAAIREIDLRNRYPHSRMDLENKLSLSTKKAKELRVSLSLDDDTVYQEVPEVATHD